MSAKITSISNVMMVGHYDCPLPGWSNVLRPHSYTYRLNGWYNPAGNETNNLPTKVTVYQPIELIFVWCSDDPFARSAILWVNWTIFRASILALISRGPFEIDYITYAYIHLVGLISISHLWLLQYSLAIGAKYNTLVFKTLLPSISW
jgi:hypothetical protein